MKIYDITRVLDESTPVYPGDPPFEKQVTEKDGFVICKISMSSHAGTHMDAPSHIAGTARNIKDISLDRLIGLCVVCKSMGDVRAAVRDGIKKVLLKEPDFDLKDISNLPLKLIGIETQTIGDYETHTAYLSKGITVVEGLDLTDVPKGRYTLIALPLKMDTDGSPARVVLLEGEIK